MRQPHWIRRILAKFGLAVVRAESLNQLLANAEFAGNLSEQTGALSSQQEQAAKQYRQLLQHQIGLKWELIHRLESSIPLKETMACPLCAYQGQAGEFKPWQTECIFEGGKLLRHQCPGCDLIFGTQTMLDLSPAELAREYEWHYQVFSEGDSTEQEIRAFHALKPSPGKKYLNWGAGAWSNSLARLRAEGWDVYGYEPHSSAAMSEPYIVTDWAALSGMRFDGIFSNNVLEHLRYPVRELTAMRDLLTEGGVMSHATPCFEYRYEFTRFHLFFFLGRSRSLLAEQADLKIVDFVVDGDFMNMVLTRQ